MPLPLLAAFGAGALMTALRVALVGLVMAIIKKLPEIITKLLVGLGIYFAVAKPAAYGIKLMVTQAFGGVTGTALETLYYLNVDDYALAIVSAYAINMGKNIAIKHGVKPGA